MNDTLRALSWYRMEQAKRCIRSAKVLADAQIKEIKNILPRPDQQLSAAGDNPLLKVEPPVDCRGAQRKAPSERTPRGKYAGGALELYWSGRGICHVRLR